MRLSPTTICLRALRGERSIRGRPLPSAPEAAALLQRLTGQNFGEDAAAWGKWLRANQRSSCALDAAKDGGAATAFPD